MGKKENGEGSYSVLPSGKTRLRATIGIDDSGKPIRKSFTAENRTACRQLYRNYMKELQQARTTPVTINPDITVAQWAEQYISAYRKGAIKDKSYQILQLLVAKLGSLGEKPIGSVRPLDVQSFFNDFSSDVSKSYVDKMYSFLRTLFDVALDNELIARNPASRLKKLSKVEGKREAFTWEEVREIIDFARVYKDLARSGRDERSAQQTAAGIVTLLLTGLRKGELLGLTYADITPDTVAVNRAVYLQGGVPTVTEGMAKTAGSIRVAPSPRIVYDMIMQIERIGDYPFGNCTGGLVDPTNFDRSYKRFFQKLRQEHPEVRYLSCHCCRHTYSTLLQQAGASALTAQTSLGHAKPEMTSRYTHADMQIVRQDCDLLYDALGVKSCPTVSNE